MTPGRLAVTLKTLRLHRKWSQRHLGGLAGVSQPMVAAIEKGGRRCSSELAGRFAVALGVDVAVLLAARCGYCKGTPMAGWACPTCWLAGPPCPW